VWLEMLSVADVLQQSEINGLRPIRDRDLGALRNDRADLCGDAVGLTQQQPDAEFPLIGPTRFPQLGTT
jgi:hypothetical protein